MQVVASLFVSKIGIICTGYSDNSIGGHNAWRSSHGGITDLAGVSTGCRQPRVVRRRKRNPDDWVFRTWLSHYRELFLPHDQRRIRRGLVLRAGLDLGFFARESRTLFVRRYGSDSLCVVQFEQSGRPVQRQFEHPSPARSELRRRAASGDEARFRTKPEYTEAARRVGLPSSQSRDGPGRKKPVDHGTRDRVSFRTRRTCHSRP